MIKVIQLATALTILSLATSCSLPKIIVLHDPLSAEEHIKLAGIYDSQGKTGLAREQYRFAVKQAPENGRAWSLLGDVAYREKDYAEAEKAYGKARDLDPANGDMLNNLAWVYVQQDKKLSKAQNLVMQALELTPDHRPYYLDTLGVIQLKFGKIPDAITSLLEATETIPRSQPDLLAEAYQHLADAYHAAGDSLAADNALERLRQLKPVTPKEPVLQP
ncbi:MAG: tetratricopeptide repeat protein [Nitrospirae bacterium]|nr:tetratricopeptide repeat protein [Nitrospirota bacterium]NTW65046.1 tetratricopeptide repeat protein [Nitrospirota bacterium]